MKLINVTTGTNTLTASSLTRTNNSIVAFSANTLGGAATNADDIKFTTSLAPQLKGGGGAAGTTTISILPYAVGQNTAGSTNWGLVTYDTNGVRALTASTEYTTFAAAAATSNARDAYTGGTSAITGKTLNAYVLDNTTSAAQTVTLTGTLTPTSGEIVFANTGGTGAITLSGGTLDFLTAEGVVTAMSSTANSITLASTITNTGGTAGVTFGGTSQINLTGTNTFTGPMTINGNVVNISSDLALGKTTNGIVLAGGTLRFNSGLTLGSSRTLTLAGAVDTVDTSGGSSTIPGQVTGAGTLVKIGANDLTLSNSTNNYTGPTYVYTGTLVTNSAPQGNIRSTWARRSSSTRTSAAVTAA